MKIELIKQEWKPISQIPKGTTVVKGRRETFKIVRTDCRQITNRFGCYSWQSAAGQVHYCGSFTKDDKRAEFKRNLEGRVCYYFENHRVSKSGQPNTNKHVFDKIKAKVKTDCVKLAVLELDSVKLDNATVPFTDFCLDPDLVKAVERLLIFHLRRQKQCSWNRT